MYRNNIPQFIRISNCEPPFHGLHNTFRDVDKFATRQVRNSNFPLLNTIKRKFALQRLIQLRRELSENDKTLNNSRASSRQEGARLLRKGMTRRFVKIA